MSTIVNKKPSRLNMEGLKDYAPDLSSEGQAKTKAYLEQRYGEDAPNKLLNNLVGDNVNSGVKPAVMTQSAQVVAQSLNGIRDNGVVGLQRASQQAAQQSHLSRLLDGPITEEDDDLPVGPGFAYMTHLFKNSGAGKKIKDKQKQAITKGLGIMTNAMDGVRTALQMLGVAGETNVDGLPIDMKDVMKIFHGEKADSMDDIDKSEFMRSISDGSTKIDKKKVRKFVNHDGSLTWEILNDDKSIMSRFTFGEYNGTKLFAQGGYKNFADLLRQARAQLGDDYRGEFDAIRRRG